MTTEGERSLKTKAKDNPWYLLATLYGEPTSSEDFALQARNRRAWNRYMSRWLKEEHRSLLTDPHISEETTEFSTEELADVQKAYIERHRLLASMASTHLPEPAADDGIDIVEVDFDKPLHMSGFLFPVFCNFSSTAFHYPVVFGQAVFLSSAQFLRTTFLSEADFEGAAFRSAVYFLYVTFSDRTNFRNASLAHSSFDGAKFEDADFADAIFPGLAQFTDTIFSGEVYFDDVTFEEGCNFDAVSFSDTSSFWHTTFSGANFDGTTFHDVSFKEAKFSGMGSFVDATFCGDASFEDATFSETVKFDGASFQSESSFINAEMKGRTSFEKVKFASEPPMFFGAKLHEGTIWTQVTWPRSPKEVIKAGKFVAAYERLKLEMDRLKKHEDELDFFALELQSRRVQSGTFRGMPIAIYGLLCNYGRSYFRPVIGLLVTVFVGALAFWPHFGLSKFPRAAGLSLANTFGAFGFRKDFIDPHIIETLSRALKVLSGLQTIAGFALLFLFGLALRNRFRMR
jgi:uncharacterized protein YjbI with pentapeptide repeats